MIIRPPYYGKNTPYAKYIVSSDTHPTSTSTNTTSTPRHVNQNITKARQYYERKNPQVTHHKTGEISVASSSPSLFANILPMFTTEELIVIGIAIIAVMVITVVLVHG